MKNLKKSNSWFTSMKNKSLLFAVLLLTAFSTPVMAGAEATYLYTFSDFTGIIPYSWVRLSIDKERNEIYVIGMSEVKVFNDKGMEIYSFGDDGSLDGIFDVAIDKEGYILVLSYKDDHYKILRCNYRGELKSIIEVKNLPSEFSRFSPTRIRYFKGRIYLIDTSSKRVALVDEKGIFLDGYDINALLDLKEKERYDKQIGGFDLDNEGNMIFTVPTMFRAFVVSPDRTMKTFGSAGNSPGKFSVVAGIAKDDRGNYLVVDTLKSVVMIFDKNFEFLLEFGYRGFAREGLIAPREAVSYKDKIYITQGRKRGVSVFKIITDQEQSQEGRNASS